MLEVRVQISDVREIEMLIDSASRTAHVLEYYVTGRCWVQGRKTLTCHFPEQIVKPFLDSKTAKKVKFVYSNDPTSMKLVNDLFDQSTLEELLKDDNFSLEEYSKQMRQDDAKFGLRRKLADERQQGAWN